MTTAKQIQMHAEKPIAMMTDKELIESMRPFMQSLIRAELSETKERLKDERSYTPRQLAELIQCHINTIYKEISRGKLKPSYYVGSDVRFLQREVDRYRAIIKK